MFWKNFHSDQGFKNIAGHVLCIIWCIYSNVWRVSNVIYWWTQFFASLAISGGSVQCPWYFPHVIVRAKLAVRVFWIQAFFNGGLVSFCWGFCQVLQTCVDSLGLITHFLWGWGIFLWLTKCILLGYCKSCAVLRQWPIEWIGALYFFFLYCPELGNESLGCSDFWVFWLNFSLNLNANFKQLPRAFSYGIYDVFIAFKMLQGDKIWS